MVGSFNRGKTLGRYISPRLGNPTLGKSQGATFHCGWYSQPWRKVNPTRHFENGKMILLDSNS